MYRNLKNDFGKGKTLYRDISEIRADIDASRSEILLILERLNPRALLTDIINDKRCNNPKNFLVSLEDTLARAEEAYRGLRVLRVELSELEDELEETLCEMKC
jgi:hypothetical protein